MKKILCLISVCVMLLLSTLTASAESVSNFDLALVSENSNQIVLSFNFEGGASFSALDFEITVNEDKVKIESIKDGEGLTNFKLQSMAVSFSNANTNPALVSAAMIPGYRNVNGNDLFVITLKRVSKDSLAEGDVTINITNCADGNSNPLKTNVTTFLSSAQSTETPSEGGNSSANEDAEKPTEDSSSAGKQELNAQAGKIQETTTTSAETSADEQGMSKTTIIVICVIAVVAVGGGAGATYIFMKKKNGKKADKDD